MDPNTVVDMTFRDRSLLRRDAAGLLALILSCWLFPGLALGGVINLADRYYHCDYDSNWRYNATDHTCCDYDVHRQWYCVKAIDEPTAGAVLLFIDVVYSAFVAMNIPFLFARIDKRIKLCASVITFGSCVCAIVAAAR